ncbi:MAG: hydrogenase formation protein HypD [Burkholderiales bacterium]|nr:hydrogenase formation protein HypD [Burkholderiales bacterium]
MKYIDEFRNSAVAKKLIEQINGTVKPEINYRLMEFCGGHTHAIHRYALSQLLPKNIKLIHGPGCPVCVLPIPRIDQAIWLASQENVILCSYADMLRVPGDHQDSLIKAKSRGADVRIIYSVGDALKIAQNNPEKIIVFFAIGFETTTPPTAHALLEAKRLGLTNFKVFCNHVLTPVAMAAILHTDEVEIDGFIGPSHVSIVIGSDAYKKVSDDYQKPIVIAGFEPLDVLQSILYLIELINNKKVTIINQYSRAVSTAGNTNAQQMIAEVLEIRDEFSWRGLGAIPHSGLKIKAAYQDYDAEVYFNIPLFNSDDVKACECPQILRGLKEPRECKLFGKACTPEHPMGACMVSSEGACAASYQYTV